MEYDVIVVGGGHAGCEAARAAARLGADTLLITSFLARVGQMSCNPAVGGVAKGTVAREIDALGGIMGRAADRTAIHFRMLNRSKGPAVWAPRAQCDRGLYPRAVRQLLEREERLALYQGTVAALDVAQDRLAGVRCVDGSAFRARAVVLTTGTFLRGAIRIGVDRSIGAGRAGDAPSVELAEQLLALGLEVGRFKTGTPPRVDGRTVDTSAMERQESEPDVRFSHWGEPSPLPRRACWLVRAGPEAKEIVAENLERSAMYGGAIGSLGPRYCPSIEDKIVKFPDAESHQLFLEPEGLETTELYVNGLSTSLPPDVQRTLLARVPGLEKARMTQPGYAIEYDYFPPHQLRPTLELRALEGLYLAGQVNGTTGYEEAAAQGLVAGVNAALACLEREPWVPRRDEAYIGVLIDDLVTRGVTEPYRLFTSRAEFRLLLRQDNCLERLAAAADRFGLLRDAERRLRDAKLEARRQVREWAETTTVQPEEVADYLLRVGSKPLTRPERVSRLVLRPEVHLAALAEAKGALPSLGTDGDAFSGVEMQMKYAGYVRRDRERAEELARREAVELPETLPYEEFRSLSTEARERLQRVRPRTLGQAARIPGVSPSDLQNLLVELKKRKLRREAASAAHDGH